MTTLRTWTDPRKLTTTGGWSWVGAHLTTKYANSRVTVYVSETVIEKGSLRLRRVNQEVTTSDETVPTPTPTPTVTATPTPTPTPTDRDPDPHPDTDANHHRAGARHV